MSSSSISSSSSSSSSCYSPATESRKRKREEMETEEEENPPCFSLLPDVFRNIVANDLGPKDLVNLSLTCKFFNKFALDPEVWLLPVETIKTIVRINELDYPALTTKDPALVPHPLNYRFFTTSMLIIDNLVSIDYVYDLINELKPLHNQIKTLGKGEELDGLQKVFDKKQQKIIELVERLKTGITQDTIRDIGVLTDRLLKQLARHCGEKGLTDRFPPEFTYRTVEAASKYLCALNKAIIKNEPTFTVLNLSYISIYQAIPQAIDQFSQLTSLILKNIGSLKSLPDSISKLSRLTVLDLTGNSFERLPECVRNLKLLENLNVSKNKLKDLPEWLPDELEKLKVLDVSENLFSKLPERLEAMQTTMFKRLIGGLTGKRLIEVKI